MRPAAVGRGFDGTGADSYEEEAMDATSDKDATM